MYRYRHKLPPCSLSNIVAELRNPIEPSVPGRPNHLNCRRALPSLRGIVINIWVEMIPRITKRESFQPLSEKAKRQKRWVFKRLNQTHKWRWWSFFFFLQKNGPCRHYTHADLRLPVSRVSMPTIRIDNKNKVPHVGQHKRAIPRVASLSLLVSLF